VKPPSALGEFHGGFTQSGASMNNYYLAAEEQFRNCFRYSSRRGAAGGDKRYHLDLAHLDILNRMPGGSTVLEVGCGGAQMRQV